ncbi:Retrovirus-related Pol polyprotein [Thelohanellus kitauei]|uniref:Retrovirus-related Pol polyprotein n=1 Tax=Thelohanellus kitauei TaxID=669202 RepID=A0A0C2J1I0_THEKT|nr:Retrovirus-related Pol polyprotein [Thelohanellus kitauei]KII71689.1 Retrovirus-related Pol polyprotein [Thelohanellus kitauei]
MDKEFFAIIWVIRKFKYYLYSSEFSVRIDHNHLTHIKDIKDMKGRRARLALELDQGKQNFFADSLARSINLTEVAPNIDITKLQTDDYDIQEIIRSIKCPKHEALIVTGSYASELIKLKYKLKLEDSILFHDGTRGLNPIVPKHMINEFISQVQD